MQDFLLVCLLFSAGFLGGRYHLASHNTECSLIALDTYVFGTGLMLASGRGFYEPDMEAAPELQAFLSGEIRTLDPAALPEEIPPAATLTNASHASETAPSPVFRDQPYSMAK